MVFSWSWQRISLPVFQENFAFPVNATVHGTGTPLTPVQHNRTIGEIATASTPVAARSCVIPK
jgi:hypothetical protein